MKERHLAALFIPGKALMCLGVFLALCGASSCWLHADAVDAQATGVEGVWVPYPADSRDFVPDQAFIFTRSEFKIKDTETPEPPLVFGYRLLGENLVLDFHAPPGWEKDKVRSMYATVDFNEWRQSKVKHSGKYLLLQLGPKGPPMRMRRSDRKIPGL
jgi:hypothetical protein